MAGLDPPGLTDIRMAFKPKINVGITFSRHKPVARDGLEFSGRQS